VTYSRPQDSRDAETHVHKALLCARSVVVCTLARIGAIDSQTCLIRPCSCRTPRHGEFSPPSSRADLS